MAVQISKQIRDKLAYAALNRLRQAISSAVTGASIQNVLFVAKDGQDSTAQPGSLIHKYSTVQAAVTAAAALPYGVVLVGPGVYTESVTIPDGSQNMAIVGMDQFSSIIQAPASQPAILLAPTATVGLLSIFNLSLFGSISSGGASVLQIDGTGVAGGEIFTGGRCSLRNILVNNSGTNAAVSITSADQIEIRDVDFDSSVTDPAEYTTVLFNCEAELWDCEIDRTFIRWSLTEVLPESGSNRCRLFDCKGSLAVSELARVELLGGYYEGSQPIGYDALFLGATDDATHVGKVEADGTHFQFTVELGADYNFVDAPPTDQQSEFANCQFNNDVTVTSAG